MVSGVLYYHIHLPLVKNIKRQSTQLSMTLQGLQKGQGGPFYQEHILIQKNCPKRPDMAVFSAKLHLSGVRCMVFYITNLICHWETICYQKVKKEE